MCERSSWERSCIRCRASTWLSVRGVCATRDPQRNHCTLVIIQSPWALIFLELPIWNHQPSPPSQLAHQLAPTFQSFTMHPALSHVVYKNKTLRRSCLPSLTVICFDVEIKHRCSDWTTRSKQWLLTALFYCAHAAHEDTMQWLAKTFFCPGSHAHLFQCELLSEPALLFFSPLLPTMLTSAALEFNGVILRQIILRPPCEIATSLVWWRLGWGRGA